MPTARPVAPATGLQPQVQGASLRPDGTMHPNQRKSGAPVLGDSFFNQVNSGEENSKAQEKAAAEKKVFIFPLWFLPIYGSNYDITTLVIIGKVVKRSEIKPVLYHLLENSTVMKSSWLILFYFEQFQMYTSLRKMTNFFMIF